MPVGERCQGRKTCFSQKKRECTFGYGATESVSLPCPQDTDPGLTQRRNTNMARALCETVPDPNHPRSYAFTGHLMGNPPPGSFEVGSREDMYGVVVVVGYRAGTSWAWLSGRLRSSALF